MTRRQQRMVLVGLLVTGVVIAAALGINAFWQNVQFFFSPSDVVAHKSPTDRNFRLGGLVETGSVQRQGDGLTIHFTVTDTVEKVNISYTGILPDLFSEGRGIVATGKMGPDGTFVAEEVLAKHDEKYMPPEVADALEKAKSATPASPTSGIPSTARSETL